MGYITKSQFRQCLSYLELPASEDEMILIESRFSNDKGFKYLEVHIMIDFDNHKYKRNYTVVSA